MAGYDLIHPLTCQAFLKQYVTEKKQYPECGSTDEQAGLRPVPHFANTDVQVLCSALLQVDGVCKVAPVVALLAGDPSMLPTVDTAVRVVQNTDKAAAFACGFARVLEKLILGTPLVQEAIAAATKDLMDPSRSFKTALDQEVAQNLERVLGELSNLSHADAGKTLKPEAVAFPFAGLS